MYSFRLCLFQKILRIAADDRGYLRNTGTVPVRSGNIGGDGYSWFIDVDVVAKVELACPDCSVGRQRGSRCLDASGATTGDCTSTAFEIDAAGNVGIVEENRGDSWTIQCTVAEQKNEYLTSGDWLDMNKPFAEYVLEYRYDSQLPLDAN